MKYLRALLIITLVQLISEVVSTTINDHDCPVSCAYLSEPLCGYNGNCYKQFDNECHMEATNCGADLRFVGMIGEKYCPKDGKFC